MKIKERFTKKLLVEGNDDQHVIWALCQKFDIPETFDVIDTEGIDNLLSQISVRLKQPNVNSIGIIIDADTDIKSRYASISALLKTQGFDFPEVLPADGLIIEANGTSIGVWMMPNNGLSGMLEDFIAFLVPEDDQLMPIVTETLGNIEGKELNKYAMIHKSKALIHSWLSLQDDPGTPMGLAITKKYLTTDEDTCQKLVNWIRRTFN
jgi:hypothetical protein